MSDLAELIARLESAQEGSRELDALIWATVLPVGHKAPVDDKYVYDLLPEYHYEFEPQADGLVKMYAADKKGRVGYEKASRYAPNFTTILDSALSLVPEGWHAIINWRDKPDGSSSVALHEFPLPCRRIPEKEPFVIAARTAALAVCIAALAVLRARQERSCTTLPPSLPPWLAMMSRTDWLYNGHKSPSEEVWAQLEWDKAWVDLGPSPMGNLGPYWHVPLNDGEETVQRLYPKLLKTKWLSLVRRAVAEREAKATAANSAAPDMLRSLSLLVTLIRMDTPRERLEETLIEAEAILAKIRNA